MNNRQYPAAIERERTNLAAEEVRAKEEIKKKLGEARELLRKDPDLAKIKTAEAQRSASLFQEISRKFKEKLSAFDEARSCYEGKMRDADKVIGDAVDYLAGLKEKGYFISPDDALSPVKSELKIARNLLTGKGKDDIPDYPLVIKYAEAAVKEAKTIQNFWQKHCDRRVSNEAKLADIKLWRETSLPQLEKFCQTALGDLKIKTPQDVWGAVETQVKYNEPLKTEFDKLIKEAERLNGMEKQDFATAGVMVDNVQVMRSSIETVLGCPRKTLQEFAEAQAKAKTLASQAAGVISQTERAVNDSDAEGAGRSKLQGAKEKLSKAKDIEKSSLPNWLLVAGFIAGAVALAKAAEREAEDRSNEVKMARRRRREEEDRRRREDEYHSGSSWSSGSSSGGHSGGGFGGFGGGGFGGGGASGGW